MLIVFPLAKVICSVFRCSVRIFQPRMCFWIMDALYSNNHMGFSEHLTHSGILEVFGQVRALWPLQPQSLQVVLPLLTRSTGDSFQRFLQPASPSSAFGDFFTLGAAGSRQIFLQPASPSSAFGDFFTLGFWSRILDKTLAARISLAGAMLWITGHRRLLCPECLQ